jgi:hypothetical protein
MSESESQIPNLGVTGSSPVGCANQINELTDHSL